jgi:endoglucanase
VSAKSQTSRVGELVGEKYRILRVIAEGGMGVVYEAQHAVVKRRFAVKFLRTDLADRRDLLTRFHREAEAAGALESENIAASIDFGILADGTPYIVMEHLVGESLGSLLAREGCLSVERAADLCVQACHGIAAAHAAGIVHRDLKPENLFVCRREDGTDLVKVLDFGIAKLEQIELDNAATRTGTILGTPAYMSPEQARGDKSIDLRTDVYGLAAILFEMVSGKKPHPGDSNNAILHHIATQPAISLHSVQPDLPPQLVAVVERALSSDRNLRPASAEALGLTLAPFAKREVRPPQKKTDSIPGVEVAPPAPGWRSADVDGPTVPAGGQPSPSRRRPWTIIAVSAGSVALVAMALAIGARITQHSSATATPAKADGRRPLPKGTRFFSPAPVPGAVQQIAELIKQKAFQDAAALTAMVATPQAVWLTGGTPEDVRSAVQTIMIRAASDHRVPILVANNIPFRDCAQYSAGGATSTAAYNAWIDGLASGIGNGKAIVIFEPDSLGIIPYNTGLDGNSDWCKPTITDAQGRTVASPGATPAERYALINYAVDSVANKAPNAALYLDGTHSGWLPANEIAYRLAKGGIRRAQGFFVNSANAQPTPQSIQYGTWISKCLYYASNPAEGGRRLGRYSDCASQHLPSTPSDYGTWALTEKWYVDNVDRAPNPPSGPSALTHFVIDTSRNGEGTLDAARFAAAPYNQPTDVIKGLKTGEWCNPTGAGVGLAPTADTGTVLVDAYLWVKPPGSSDGACDIAGGARAWDYSKYNPWGMTGDAQRRFDPLWGMVDPGAGEWFPELALQLAQNAKPALRSSEPSEAAVVAASPETQSTPAIEPRPPSGLGDRPRSTRNHSGRPLGRPAGRPAELHDLARAPSAATPPSGATPSRPARVTFDTQNPYGD